MKKTRLLDLLFHPFRISATRKLPDNPERILVIRQDNRIGNLILITPFLKMCRELFPNSKIDVVVGGFFGEVIRNNPCINSLHIYNQLKFIRFPWLFLLFIFRLRRSRYNIVFDMKSDLSFNNIMLTLLCGAKFRIGFRNEISKEYYDMTIPINYALYEAEILTTLLTPWKPAGKTPSITYIPKKEAVEKALKVLRNNNLPSGKTVGIHTGGRGAKRIALSDFLSLGQRLIADQHPVIFFFGPDELSYMLQFKEAGFICICPKRVEDFGGFLPHMSHFISCDTGPMHMAAGAGVSTYSIFVNSSPERYAPRGDKHKIIRSVREINLTEISTQLGNAP
ncbi:MAG: glycosyltransferase family 9 protein [Fibrobacteres bacterium]|nr:glycosyltransferase family 9 protein [Fibrobacterota bacterium]